MELKKFLTLFAPQVLLDMDIMVAHLMGNKAAHQGISLREYNEKFLQKTTRTQVKKEFTRASVEEVGVQRITAALDATTEVLFAEDEERTGKDGFMIQVPQFRTFIDSLVVGKQVEKWSNFPALEKLLLMDISTEESILEGANQFSAAM